MTDRKTLLERLINLDAPVTELTAALHRFGWDCNEPLVQVRRKDVIAVLNRYLRSDLTESDIEEWADAIEGREDIGLESSHDKTIHAVLFALANPMLTKPLSMQTARELIGSLN